MVPQSMTKKISAYGSVPISFEYIKVNDVSSSEILTNDLTVS